MKKILLVLVSIFILLQTSFAEYRPTISDKSVINKLETIINKKFNTNEKLKLLINKATELRDKQNMDSQKYYLFNSLVEICNKKIANSFSITIIDDKRCANCDTSEITKQLKELDYLKNIKFINKDFSDIWVKSYLEQNNITKLPIFIFSTNTFKWAEIEDKNWQIITDYLTKLSNWKYYLEVWAKFNPFEDRSNRWFLIIDKEKLQNIKSDSYIKWNKNAKITWIEYSDLECPFCSRMHESGTPDALKKIYENDLNIIFQHSPLSFHQNAQDAAEITECLWKQKWSETFYELIEKSFLEKDSSAWFLIKESLNLWWDPDKITQCLNDKDFTDKVTNQMTRWQKYFSISGTPGNVLINNETWEYQILSWAYPLADFVKVINSLLK